MDNHLVVIVTALAIIVSIGLMAEVIRVYHFIKSTKLYDKVVADGLTWRDREGYDELKKIADGK